MENDLEKEVKPYTAKLLEHLADNRGQCLLVGPDPTVLDCILSQVCDKARYACVNVTTQREENPKHKIFFINLINWQSLEYQALLYYYLELPLHHDCFVCLVSISCLCLNALEKRVRSRFKNNVIFVPYFAYESASSKPAGVGGKARSKKRCPVLKPSHELPFDKSFSLFPSVRDQKRKALLEKYALPAFSVDFALDLLCPIHFAILIIAAKNKVKFYNVVETFRQKTINISPIKKVSDLRILYCYYDLLDSGLLNTAGDIIVDFAECRKHIDQTGPLYIKKMLCSIAT